MGSICRLSTVEVMEVAKARFHQMSCQKVVDPSMISQANASLPICLSDDDNEDVELAYLLLASAEKIRNQKFERASEFLHLCRRLSSQSGNCVQKVVYYFASALEERINQTTRRVSSLGLEEEEIEPSPMGKALMSMDPAMIAWFQQLPFYQITQFAGVQAILDNVSSAKRVHIIDLEIDCGVQWTVLMEAFASSKEHSVEFLKVTAVVTTVRQNIEAVGKRLASLAKTKNLPFSFRVVTVPDIKDIKEDNFELEACEVVAVYSPMFLGPLVGYPDRLVSLFSMFRYTNPCVVVVHEVEANHSSPLFIDRFHEALHFYGAYFDSFDACMDRSDPNRITAESVYLKYGIDNIVASEGEERVIRHAKIKVWRELFSQFGMRETELSPSSLFQAREILKTFACAKSCTLKMDGECLLIGWKGTSMYSLSAWKLYSGGKSGSEIRVPLELSAS